MVRLLLYTASKVFAPGQGTRPTNSCRPRALTRRVFCRRVCAAFFGPNLRGGAGVVCLRSLRFGKRLLQVADGFPCILGGFGRGVGELVLERGERVLDGLLLFG